MKDGFVYVASVSEAYYKAAVRSAISLKDNYPEADITLFTHKSFFKEEDRKFFNNVNFDIPVHVRAKMWGMARSPYDRTLYVDADTEIRSERIAEVFDILGDNDIMFTRIIPHVSKDRLIDKDNELEYHGGIILYNSKDITIQLMHDWYNTYVTQINTYDWENSKFAAYSKKLRPWDQFTIWYLLQQEEYKSVRHDFFPEGGHEFNYIYLLEDKKSPFNEKYSHIDPVIFHYSIPRGVVDASNIKHQFGINGDFD